MTKCIFSTAAVLGLLLAMASSGAAQTYFTQSSGSWEYAGYWSNGIPTSSTSAYVGGPGGYTANVTQLGDAASSLYLGTGGSAANVGPGTVNVTAGSSLAVGGTLYIGNQNSGTLSITNGGSVSCGDWNIANDAGIAGAGYVTVDGSGSTLATTGNFTQLTYAGNAIGVMQISNGGTLSCPNAMVNGNDNGGFAYVNVLNGGTVNNGTTGTTWFNYNGGQGFGIVDGTGSSWTGNRIVLGGHGGSQTAGEGGTIQISNGATATFNGGSSNIANANGTYGNVYVLTGGTLNQNGGSLNIASSAGDNVAVAVNGSGSLLEATGSASLSVASATVSSGPGTLYIANGGTLNASGGSMSVNNNGTVSIDVGYNSQLQLPSSGLSNSGAVRVVCGTDPSTTKTYQPIMANGSPFAVGGTVQAVGGTWSSGTFTPSAVVTGTLGSATSLNTSSGSDQDRALWTDSNGNTLGASFLDNNGTQTPSVTALGASAATSSGLTLAANQAVLEDWGLSGVSTSNSNPVYLSLSAKNSAYDDYTLWAYNGTTWSEIVGPSAAALSNSSNPGVMTNDTVANDLAFDGASYGFSLTATLATPGNSGGLALDFNGYDYAVVGTQIGTVHHPGQVIVTDPVVDVNDLTIVLAHFGETGCTWSQGAIDGDPAGTVDVNDLTIVLANFGTNYGAGAPGAVPEPASLVLLLVGAIGWLACRRRKRA